nr:response regulator [Pseudooceanicola algae]
MRVLIVESETQLGWIWKRHFDRNGSMARLVHGQDAAIECLRNEEYDVIVLDLVLDQGSALAIADFANYRQPATKVIFVTNTSFFSDGSIFQHATNACALMNSTSPPSDIAAMADHFGAEAREQIRGGKG